MLNRKPGATPSTPQAVPVSYRIEAGLKDAVDRVAAQMNRTSTDLVQESIRMYLSGLCPNCQAYQARLAPGLGSGFDAWAKRHRGEGVYLFLLEENNRVVAYKGKLLREPLERTVVLDRLVQGSGQERDAELLRQRIIDWAPGDHGPDTFEIERSRPGVVISEWNRQQQTRRGYTEAAWNKHETR